MPPVLHDPALSSAVCALLPKEDSNMALRTEGVAERFVRACGATSLQYCLDAVHAYCPCPPPPVPLAFVASPPPPPTPPPSPESIHPRFIRRSMCVFFCYLLGFSR